MGMRGMKEKRQEWKVGRGERDEGGRVKEGEWG